MCKLGEPVHASPLKKKTDTIFRFTVILTHNIQYCLRPCSPEKTSSCFFRHHIIRSDTAKRLPHPVGGVGREEDNHHVSSGCSIRGMY